MGNHPFSAIDYAGKSMPLSSWLCSGVINKAARPHPPNSLYHQPAAIFSQLSTRCASLSLSGQTKSCIVAETHWEQSNRSKAVAEKQEVVGSQDKKIKDGRRVRKNELH